jgi:hypothetical protein
VVWEGFSREADPYPDYARAFTCSGKSAARALIRACQPP